MKYLTGEGRQQVPLFVGCLEEAIEADNHIQRLIAIGWALLVHLRRIAASNLRRIFNL